MTKTTVRIDFDSTGKHMRIVQRKNNLLKISPSWLGVQMERHLGKEVLQMLKLQS